MDDDHLADAEFWQQQADAARKLADEAPSSAIRRALLRTVDQCTREAEKAAARLQLSH